MGNTKVLSKLGYFIFLSVMVQNMGRYRIDMGQVGYFLFPHYVHAQGGMGQIGYFRFIFSLRLRSTWKCTCRTYGVHKN